MTQTANLRIAVVGAGVAGLAAALYAHRLGHQVTVVERFAAPRPVGSGLLLQPTGLTVLADLGLADAIMDLGQRIDRLAGADTDNDRVVLDVAYRGGRFGLAVHRAALFNVLYDAVVAAGIEIVTSCEVSGIRRRSAGLSLFTSGGGTACRDADLVVDASGGASQLVDLAGRGAIGRELAYGALWASLDWPGAPFDPHALAQRYRHASIMIGVLPIGRRHSSAPRQCAFFWSLKPGDLPAVRAAGIGKWKQQVEHLWPATAPLLEQIRSFDDVTLARYGHRTLHQPWCDRLLHIGDSAHATSPQLGQGANMALLDARALAHALATCTACADVGPTYARMRRRHVRVYQFMSRALTPFYQSDGRLIPFMRDTLVATLARVPPMPAILADLVSGTLVDPYRTIGLEECAPCELAAGRWAA
ncbi:MAG: NAD(P)/FAD-dependent oxidoreductase [Hyphomicrobiaceae bacterium]